MTKLSVLLVAVAVIAMAVVCAAPPALAQIGPACRPGNCWLTDRTVYPSAVSSYIGSYADQTACLMALPAAYAARAPMPVNHMLNCEAR